MKALLTADEFRMYENLVHATGSPIAVHNEEHFHIASGGIGQKP
jgi:hypothetical protein